jgi:hypothetical protein
MRLPRFTTLQLLLAATLAALVVGLFAAAWRASGVQQRFRFGFSPDGSCLIMRHVKGPTLIWQIDGDQPRLIRKTLGENPLSPLEMNSILHLDEHEIASLLKNCGGHTGTGEIRYTFYRTPHSTLSQVVHIAIFIIGFAMWAAVWGVIRKPRRQWLAIASEPLALKLCWGLMVVGGLVAVGIPIVMMFIVGPRLFPTIYFSLLVGLAAIARGAARETVGLRRTAALQLANIMALDPANVVFAAMEYSLIRTARVQEFLREANG